MSKHQKILIYISPIIILFFLAGLFYLNDKEEPTPIVIDVPAPAIVPNNASNTKDLSIGENNLVVEIADTEEKRSLGLGGRSDLGADQGMLFVFDHSDRYGFWMKDTLIPLDMIWIDQNKKIIDIKSDILPETFPKVFYPSAKSLYVLEVNAGYAKAHQIKIGESLNF